MDKHQKLSVTLGILLLTFSVGLVVSCALFSREDQDHPTTPATVPGLALSNAIFGDAGLSEWGASYVPGNRSACINIPFAAAVRIIYTTRTGMFAVFARGTGAFQLEIGLMERDGVVDVIDAIWVDYLQDGDFQTIPDEAQVATHTVAKRITVTHYLRGGHEPWWPVDAAFAFNGPFRTEWLVIGSEVVVATVPCPFPKPEPTTTSSTTPAVQPIILWVTAGTWNGDLGGVTGADAKCAADPNRPAGYANVRAVISASTQAARDIVSGAGASDRPVIRLDGITLIDASWNDLWDGGLVNAVGTAGGVVWTGTSMGGTASLWHCLDWVSATNAATGMAGWRAFANQTWVMGGLYPCGMLRRLYCVSW